MQDLKFLKITLAENIRLSHVPDTLYETLTEKLVFDNPKWIENQRMGRWNKGTPRRLRFYKKAGVHGLRIPRGYMRRLILTCRRLEIPFEIEDLRRNLPPVEFGFSGRLKPFQQKAVDAMLARDFGTLNAPTGSGKTVMALHMVHFRQQPALVVVHTKELAFQWLERIGTFMDVDPETVGFIGQGKRVMGAKITVALVQSLCKCAQKVAKDVGFLIVDECHRCPSRTFTDAVTCFDARFMLGLSATPWRRDKLSKLIFWHLGDIHYQMEKEALIESGDVLAAEVILRETEFKPYYDPVREYSKMLSELTSDDKRNHLIASDVARAAGKCQGVCLVLSDRKRHCEILEFILRYKYDLQPEKLTGDVSAARRKIVLERLHRGEVKVLVATGQLIGEGFDFKGLSTLFLATPIRFSGRVIQYLGRVLRPAPGKKKALVYDYVDIHVDVLKAAARSRQRIYG